MKNSASRRSIFLGIRISLLMSCSALSAPVPYLYVSRRQTLYFISPYPFIPLSLYASYIINNAENFFFDQVIKKCMWDERINGNSSLEAWTHGGRNGKKVSIWSFSLQLIICILATSYTHCQIHISRIHSINRLQIYTSLITENYKWKKTELQKLTHQRLYRFIIEVAAVNEK